jgi:GH18 family chitinase
LQYCQQLASPNFTHVKLPKEQNFAFSGKTVIVYDGIESLRAKADYARQNMAGMSIYQLHHDDSMNKCGCGNSPYLRTVAEVLKGRDCILKPCF